MPLSMLFGPEALEYRLQDSEAVVAICDESSIANVAQVRGAVPALRDVVGVGAAAAAGRPRLGGASPAPCCHRVHAGVATQADEGAVLIYTSGTTGPPKGALIPHRALIGNLRGSSAARTGSASAAGGASEATRCSGRRPTGPGPAA
jgi:acetyl-CoA synthetase